MVDYRWSQEGRQGMKESERKKCQCGEPLCRGNLDAGLEDMDAGHQEMARKAREYDLREEESEAAASKRKRSGRSSSGVARAIEVEDGVSESSESSSVEERGRTRRGSRGGGRAKVTGKSHTKLRGVTMDPTPAVQREQDEDDDEEEVDLEASSVGSGESGRVKQSVEEREKRVKMKEHKVMMKLELMRAKMKTEQAEYDRWQVERDRSRMQQEQSQREEEVQRQQMQQGGRVSGLYGVEGSPQVQTPAQQQPLVRVTAAATKTVSVSYQQESGILMRRWTGARQW